MYWCCLSSLARKLLAKLHSPGFIAVHIQHAEEEDFFWAFVSQGQPKHKQAASKI